jgi:hypothetical protein
MSILANNADWSALNSEMLQKVIDNPKTVGMQFTLFLKNGGKVIVVEPKIIPINRIYAFDPIAFIGQGWKIVEQDERSLALNEIDLSKILFETMLTPTETTITGEDKQKRLKHAGHIRLDAKIFQTLWENQHLIPESWKEKVNGNTKYILFDGTVLQNSHGHRYVLYLYWHDGRWHWYYVWLVDAWYAGRPSAVLAS